MDGLDRYKLGKSRRIGSDGVRDLVKQVRSHHLHDPDAKWEHRVMAERIESHMLCGFWSEYSPATQSELMDPTLTVAEKHLEGLRVWVCRDSTGYRLYSRTLDPRSLFPERLPVMIDTFTTTVRGMMPNRAIFDGILALKDRRVKQTLERSGVRLVGDRPQRVLWELVRHPDFIPIQCQHSKLTELFLFDYVYRDDEWIGDKTFEERRHLLERVCFDSRAISLTKLYKPAKALSLMRQHGWDGVVIKKRDSHYRASPSRSTRWVKVQPDPPEPWYGATDWYSSEPASPLPQDA